MKSNLAALLSAGSLITWSTSRRDSDLRVSAGRLKYIFVHAASFKFRFARFNTARTARLRLAMPAPAQPRAAPAASSLAPPWHATSELPNGAPSVRGSACMLGTLGQAARSVPSIPPLPHHRHWSPPPRPTIRVSIVRSRRPAAAELAASESAPPPSWRMIGPASADPPAGLRVRLVSQASPLPVGRRSELLGWARARAQCPGRIARQFQLRVVCRVRY